MSSKKVFIGILLFTLICTGFIYGFVWQKEERDTSAEEINLFDAENDVLDTEPDKLTSHSKKFLQGQDISGQTLALTDEPTANTSEILRFPIHIMGEVKNPGVYYFSNGDIVKNAIEKADGLTKNANLLWVNLAEKMQPNQKIYIPSIEDKEMTSDKYLRIIAASERDDFSAEIFNSPDRININTATAAELQNLKGIGPDKAADIIAYRQKNGDFGTIEDIMNIAGIKIGTFEKIKERICVH